MKYSTSVRVRGENAPELGRSNAARKLSGDRNATTPSPVIGVSAFPADRGNIAPSRTNATSPAARICARSDRWSSTLSACRVAAAASTPPKYVSADYTTPGSASTSTRAAHAPWIDRPAAGSATVKRPSTSPASFTSTDVRARTC